MQSQLPVLLVIIPLISALMITVLGWFNKKWCFPITVVALGVSALVSVLLLCQVVEQGPLHYFLGSWVPPFGIEYKVDHLNSMVLCIVAVVSFLVAIFSKHAVEKELPDRIAHYYTLFVLLVTGLLGMTITGDAFNLYVLVEIAALTSYALLAMGKGRAYMSTFNYVIMGTIGACFYLLGVGYLYMKTGTLNMGDLSQLLPQLHYSEAILVGFVLIMVGVWIKMAFFPLHGWLPNAYTFAPIASSCLIAPLMTKVSVYIMIRMMFSVFNANYVFNVVSWSPLIVWLSVGAIVAGSLFALSQKNLKKMLTFLIVAEVGYMVGGVWLGNEAGFRGAVYHILADAMMTACLFMAIGAIFYKNRAVDLKDMKGLFHRMPWTMAAFVLGGFSMIGIPPTCGFFSKWYLIQGAFESGQWHFIVALLFSSLVNAVLFFRVIEVAYFQALPDEDVTVHHSHEKVKEAPLSMLAPLLLSAASLIGLGLYTNEIMTFLIDYAIPKYFL